MLYRDCARPPPPPLQADRRQVSTDTELRLLQMKPGTEYRQPAHGAGAKLLGFLFKHLI